MQVQNPTELCAGCPAFDTGIWRVETEYDPANYTGILIVGEAPWSEEVAQHRPFVGASGQILEKWLRKVGMARREVAISNTLWCKPPNDTYFVTQESMTSLAHCFGHLEASIVALQPKVIVTMGATALRRVAGVTGLIEPRAPRAGYAHRSTYGPVIPAPHPMYIVKGNAQMEPYALLALQRAKEIAGLGQPASPPPAEWPHVWLDQRPPLPDLIDKLMLDIETDTLEVEDKTKSAGNIVRIGLSWLDAGNIVACSLPWDGHAKDFLRQAISNSVMICFWNQTFDKPRLEAAGLNFERVRVRDAMLVWHFLMPNLPKGLGAAGPFFWKGEPWKHLSGQQPALYNGLDAYMQLLILNGCEASLGQRIQHYISGPEKVLNVLDRASKQGIWVDVEARRVLKTEVVSLQYAAQTKLDLMVPVDVRPMKVWKRQPTSEPARSKALPLPGGGWGLRLPFLPNSPKQVHALAKHLGIKLPDTNEKTLERFPHPAFQAIVDMRKLNDTLSNFLMHPAADGAVHPRFSYFPETFRKSCREPNLQSLPARHPLAKKIRAQLRARPGHVFVAGDSSAIEAVIVGWLAKSPRYIKLAKSGVHGWLASALMNEPIDLSDPELAVRCKAAKKRWPVEYDKCKRVVHLSNYVGTAARMMLEYPGTFANEKEAAKLQRFYLDSEPGQDVVAWQRRTVELAHRQGYLETPWGVRNYYQRALVYNPKTQKWAFGEQAKEAVAFMPQSIASSVQDYFILTLPGWMAAALRLVRHDELLNEVEEARRQEALDVLVQVMTQPIPQLDGLTFGVETKWGYDLNLEGE